MLTALETASAVAEEVRMIALATPARRLRGIDFIFAASPQNTFQLVTGSDAKLVVKSEQQLHQKPRVNETRATKLRRE
jgi:hypothetical protein